jgi:hypothetical protein
MEYMIVPLEAPGTTWANLVRFVERSGQPLWLEADGEVRGVLLPAAGIPRLMALLEGESPALLAMPTSAEDMRPPPIPDSHLADEF